MKPIYIGKTKDVYQLNNDQLLLKFKDDVTGNDGVFDPGSNQVGLRIAGMGKLNLATTNYFLDHLETKGILTHRVNYRPQTNEMVVKACQPFGEGLEIIFRHYAVGSFVRRYGKYATTMMPLNQYVEFTLKDDERQDPLITKEGLLALKILTPQQYDDLVSQTKTIATLITELLAKKNLQLIDLKLEFGTTNDQTIVLMDELSAGNMRVYQDGQALDPIQLSNLILS